MMASVEGSEYVEQPLTGFDYSYWFECVDCKARVNIPADLYERQTSYTPPARPEPFSRCEKCDAEVDVTVLRPVLRNLDDVALQGDNVDGLHWYHTSPYENWPDATTRAAEFEADSADSRIPSPFTPQQQLETHLSRALHIGTYEAAIENMLRRLRDEDRRDGGAAQYWLHRVQIHLTAGDLAPGVGEELSDFMGNVQLSMLQDHGGAGAVRYVNTNEADGSISVAIDPAVITSVASIPIPIEEIAVETTVAVEASARAAAALAQNASSQPDTSGIDDRFLRFPTMLQQRFPDPADPFRQRAEAVATQLRAFSDRHELIWETLKTFLESEYLPAINEQVRRRFYDALPDTRDPEEYHRSFRSIAALIARPAEVIAQFAHTPVRYMTNPEQ
jgi:hypothetical protein